MTQNTIHRDPVEELAEEFLARFRRGERPALTEYTAAHPELADEIRDLFPALVLMEEVKSGGTESHAPSAVGSEKPPAQLGDYRILREVARGGMGVVYEAEQVSLGRHVALKVLPNSAAGGDSLRLLRFRREARSAARLHHTNIVPVFEIGVAEGVHFYAMQFIQGQGLDEVLQELRRLRTGERVTERPVSEMTLSLADGLRTGLFPACPVPTPRPSDTPVPHSESSALVAEPAQHYFRSVARLGVQAAEALTYAHSQRVLHRDIKPSNLLLDRHGTLWLTDFGLAKDDGDNLTRTGDIIGTLRYMAPERFNGVSDPRTDVYALGVTLYEMLTLQPAFADTDRMRLIQRIAKEEPPKPRAIDPTIPRDLETIVLKAIAKEPGRRYPTAAAFAEDLRRFLSDRPIKARRTSWREQAWRWCRRNPAVATTSSVAFGLLVVLVVGLAVGTLLIWRAKSQVEAAKGEVEAALDRQRRVLYIQRIALADRELQANNLARAEELLAECPEDLRGWEWHYLNRSWGRVPPALHHPRAVTGRGALSPDGRRLAAGGMDGTVFLWDLPAGRLTELPAHVSPCQVAFSADGRFLVTADEPDTGNATVKLWDPTTRQLLHRWEYPHGAVESLAVGRDGRRVAIGSYRKGVRHTRVDVWEAATGRLVAEVEGGHTSGVRDVAFSPDGRLVASASPDGVVRISETESGRPVHEFRHDRRAGFHFWCLAFSPDGRHLSAGYGNEVNTTSGGVFVWDVASGEVTGSLSGRCVLGICYGPDGRLATGADDGTVHLWDLAAGQELLTLRGHINCTRFLGFTPDGHRLVTTADDRFVRVWDATPVQGGEHLGDERLTFRDHADGVFMAQLLPGGRELVTTGSDGAVRVRPLGGGSSRVVATGDNIVVAVAPAGGLLMVVNGNAGRLVDARTGETRREFELPADTQIDQLVFSPDGRLLAGREYRSNFVWDVETGRIRHRLGGHTPWVYGLAFRSGKASRLTTVSTSGEVFVWDPTTGNRLAAFEHPAACAVAFSPDGRHMATGGWDRVVQLWDTSSDDPRGWKKLDAYHDPTGGPNAVTFSPDGRLLAWGGTDSAVKVWRLGTREVATLRGHRNWVWDVEFRPDGSEIVSASRDATIKLWANPFPQR